MKNSTYVITGAYENNKSEYGYDRYVVYSSYEESYIGFANLMHTEYYSDLFGRSIHGWAYGLEAKGYCGDKGYGDDLLGVRRSWGFK